MFFKYPYNCLTYTLCKISVFTSYSCRVSPVDHHTSCRDHLILVCRIKSEILYRGEWPHNTGGCFIFSANGSGSLHQGLVLSVALSLRGPILNLLCASSWEQLLPGNRMISFETWFGSIYFCMFWDRWFEMVTL